MDRSPLLATDWYDPKQYHFVKRTSHIFEKGIDIKIQKQAKINYTQTQPEHSKIHNCTASLMDSNLYNYPWITIRCDEQFNASYFCQPLHSQRIQSVEENESNVTCDGKWLLLKGANICVLVLDANDRELSFYDSQYMCSVHNSSVFSVDISDRLEPEYEYNSNLKSVLLHKSNDQLLQALHFVKISEMKTFAIYNILFGRRLNRNLKKSILPFLVNSAMGSHITNTTFFADFNGTCSILQSSLISRTYANRKYPTDRWGVKCRACSQKIKISKVICEKPAEIYINRCQKHQFECHDKTCILYTYKCDHTTDCPDNSDENTCSYGLSTKMKDQYVLFPCSPNIDCGTNSGNLIHVHDICDGVYYNNTFPDEKDICIAFNHRIFVKPTKIIHKKTSYSTIRSTDVAKLFNIEINNNCSEHSNRFDVTYNDTKSYDAFLESTLTDENNLLNQMCVFGAHGNRCSALNCDIMCHEMSCPGLFKCYDGFCLPLSLLCDEIYDCTSGEDESMCSTLTCPGSLKCRGENRCISTHEICDKRVNCLHTMDDELECDTCPVNCECRGYVMTCHSNNSEPILHIESGELLYTKGLLIKGIRRVLFTKQLQVMGLIFLNMSSCDLKEIYILQSYTTPMFSLIIIDFRRNQLTTTNFMNGHIFWNVVFVDLSFNLLHTFNFGRHVSLRYLSTLYLIGNNLKQIGITSDKNHLALIDLQLISYHPSLVVRIDHNSNMDTVVKVTDSQLCCMFSNQVKCLSETQYMKCYGLIDIFEIKMLFYCPSLLSFCLSIFALLKQVIQFTSKDKRNASNHYFLILVNMLSDCILISLYLTALTVIDMININVLNLKTSAFCITLNGILYISSETLIVFKSIMIALIMIKIKLPFKHQCTWVKWVVPASGVVWLLITTTFLIYIVVSFQEQDQFIFDKLCSICWCDMNIKFNMLHATIYIVDNLCLLNYIINFSVIYSSLNEHQNKLTLTGHSKHNLAITITCKLIIINILEIIIRIYLFTLLTLNLAHIKYAHFCWYFFLCALPMNIICFDIIYLVK